MRVVSYKVRMVCDKCGAGYMMPTGEVMTTFPLKYPHKCSQCGFLDSYLDVYPRMEYHETVIDDESVRYGNDT